jgi:hypothetical protein
MNTDKNMNDKIVNTKKNEHCKSAPTEKALWYSIIGLGLCSGILLIERFIIPIPDWLAIGLVVIAIISFVMSFIEIRRNKN